MKRSAVHLWILLFAVAVVGFALLSHRDAFSAWRWALLGLAGIGLCGGWVVLDHPVLTVFGKTRAGHPALPVVVLACLGIVAAVSYRRLLDMPCFPSSVHWFAAVAVAIGLTEEILWRGWMQGALAGPLGPVSAALVTAASHTAYKTAMLALPPASEPPPSMASFGFMAACTFGVGVGLGLSRVWQGTIVPAVAFHVLFDLLVYGSCAAAPWWVW